MENDALIPATGAYESPLDPRDWPIASVAGTSGAYAVSRMMESQWNTAANQRKIGCCVGCTGERVVRRMMYLMTGITHNPGTPEELSFRFVYALAKACEGKVVTFPDGQVIDFTEFAPVTEGTYPALVAKLIRKIGVPLAKYCVNDTTLDHETFVYHRDIANMPKAAFFDAVTRRSGADFTVPVTEQGIKQAINFAADNKGGVMILRSIGESYWKGRDGVTTWDKAKLIPITPPHSIVSGHEEELIGYVTEDGTGRVKIYSLNHWSPAWCSTGGVSNDGGGSWEYLDEWLPFIKEIRVCVPAVQVVPAVFTYNFTKAMKVGDQGADVVALQHVLMLEKCFPIGQSFTGKYGFITQAGVSKLQEKYAAEILAPSGLVHGTGNVGPRTLAWIIAHYGIKK